LNKILRSALKAHGLQNSEHVSETQSYWDASFFQVQNSSLYLSMEHHQQDAFLKSMSNNLLKEACAIETAGLTYAARMNLLSKSVEEKIIYSLIGAEEALHLKSLEPFLASPMSGAETPYFAGLIGQWINTLERPSLLVMIQILLEGWGLKYYHSLAQGSLNPQLRGIFDQILQDEARHHATGVVLYRQEKLNASERSLPEEQLATLFNCVRVGPQQAAVELAVHSSAKNIDFAKLLTAMNATDDSNIKLDRLHRLLEKTFDEKLIESCQTRGLFTALPVEQMAMMAEDQFQQILKNSAPVQGLPKELSL
jgi:hypothetical protein